MPVPEVFGQQPGQHMVAQRRTGPNAQHLQLLLGRESHALHIGSALQQRLRARQQGAAVVIEYQPTPRAIEELQRQHAL